MHSTLFIQSPPVLGNQYGDDALVSPLWFAVVSECIEAFGGAGYVEDTGLPALLRDTQVLPKHVAAACRFAATPIDLLTDINSEDSARLIE